LMPPRRAARSFLLQPPIAVTSPRSVISPVIATWARTGIPVSAETKARHRRAGARPSFGVAPSGRECGRRALEHVS